MANRASRWSKLVLLGFGYWALQTAPAALGATTFNVSIGDNFFNPSSVTISVNDIVKWTWNGANSHSSTSDTGIWDSGIGGNGMTFSRTFASAGSFPYHCNVHSFQTGTVTVQAPANSPPSVTITNPSSGTVFSEPATFTIRATASDSDGSVTNVQFRQGTTTLTNDTSVPYSVTISNFTAANYTFSAVASDNKGAKATNTISIIVNALPAVAITNPANGAVFSAPAAVAIMAAASDSDGSVTNVQFLQGAAVLTNRPSAPYSITVSNLGAGSYALSAVASDNRGGKSTNAISVSVVTPVAIVLSAGQRPSATSFQFSYSANPGLRYVVERSGNLISWSLLITNTAGSGFESFLDTNAATSPGFYRVERLPNP